MSAQEQDKVLRRVVIATNKPEQAKTIDNIDIMRIKMREKEKDPDKLEKLTNRKEFILSILENFVDSNKKWLG